MCYTCTYIYIFKCDKPTKTLDLNDFFHFFVFSQMVTYFHFCFSFSIFSFVFSHCFVNAVLIWNDVIKYISLIYFILNHLRMASDLYFYCKTIIIIWIVIMLMLIKKNYNIWPSEWMNGPPNDLVQRDFYVKLQNLKYLLNILLHIREVCLMK